MRLVLVDDSALFRQGLAGLLTSAGNDVLAERTNPEGLVDLVRQIGPDVVVLDIRMPPTWTTEGLDAALDLRRQCVDVAVLVLSQYVETAHAVRLLAGQGAVGYLLKDRVTNIGQLTGALDQIAAGGSVIDPEVVETLMRHRPAERLARLTDRERDVLTLIAQGRSNRAVCAELHLGERTVETHISSIFAKLEITASGDDHRRVLAVLAHLRD